MNNMFGVTEKGFIKKTYDEILNGLYERAIVEFGADINLSESSPLGKYLKVIAWEESILWEDFEDSYYQLHLLHARGNGLDMHGSNFNDPRREGTKSKGQVTITSNEDMTLEKGFKVSTLDNIIFETIETVKLSKNKTTIVDIASVDIGLKYNVDEKTIIRIVNPILGIISVVNEEKTYGGSDLELDIEYRDRLLFNRRTPLTGDNLNQYIYWAKEVPGVGSVKVLRATPKPGYATIVITDNKGQAANEQLIQEVDNHISELKPVNAGIVIKTATTKEIVISVKVKISKNYSFETIQSEIEIAISDYFKEISLEQDYVSHAKISSIIFNVNGVIDHNNLLLNGAAKNIELEDLEIPILKSINIIEMEQ